MSVYQSYVSHLVGFFLVEESVARLTGGLVPPAPLWDAALTAVEATLGAAFEAMREPEVMVTVKDHVSLACTCLAAAGYPVGALTAMALYLQLQYADCPGNGR